MFATIEFLMVAALFTNLLLCRGAQLLAAVKGAASDVEKKL